MSIVHEVFEHIRAGVPVSNPQLFIDKLVAMHTYLLQEDDDYRALIEQDLAGADANSLAIENIIQREGVEALKPNEAWVLQALFEVLQLKFFEHLGAHQDSASALQAPGYDDEALGETTNEDWADFAAAPEAEQVRRLGISMSMTVGLMNVSRALGHIEKVMMANIKEMPPVSERVSAQIKALCTALGVDDIPLHSDRKELAWLFQFGHSIQTIEEGAGSGAVRAAGLFAASPAAAPAALLASNHGIGYKKL